MITRIDKKVQGFYNNSPFPNYELERFKSKEDLEFSASQFAQILNQNIPLESSILDVGTGTGQLSAYLSLKRKCVYGIDFSDSSLNKARKLKEKLQLDSWNIKKVDILNIDHVNKIGKKFDFVLCLGVLHHTGQAYKGFNNIMNFVKPGGFIAIGLYNRYGRILLKLRALLAKTLFKNNNKFKNWAIRLQIGNLKDKERAKGWWNDQYLHPHETTHTIGEVLKWFRKNHIEYYGSIPSTKIFYEGDMEIEGVWNNLNKKKPNIFIRAYKQLRWIWVIHKEGGYWIMLGKKNE